MSDRVNKEVIIIGIGNPVLRDDGAGIYAARMIKRSLKDLDELSVDVEETAQAGLELIELMEGYEKGILIDSIKTPESDVGTIYKLGVEELNRRDPLSVHLMDITTALELGKKVGVKLPGSLSIYAIGVLDNSTFGEEMTPEVKQKLPDLVHRIIEDLMPGRGEKWSLES